MTVAGGRSASISAGHEAGLLHNGMAPALPARLLPVPIISPLLLTPTSQLMLLIVKQVYRVSQQGKIGGMGCKRGQGGRGNDEDGIQQEVGCGDG